MTWPTLNAAGKPVALCGELAGRPRAFLLQLGTGMHQLSLSPALIPTIKSSSEQRQSRTAIRQSLWKERSAVAHDRAVAAVEVFAVGVRRCCSQNKYGHETLLAVTVGENDVRTVR